MFLVDVDHKYIIRKLLQKGAESSFFYDCYFL